MSSTENIQLVLLQKIKKFFNKHQQNTEAVSSLDYFYLCPYGTNKGSSRLFFFFNKILAFKIYIIATFKDLYKALKIGKFSILNFNKSNKYKTVIFNWGNFRDFDTKGNFYDKHFNVNSSSCPQILWVIIYQDDKIPLVIGKNVALIYNEKKILNFYNLIKILFTTIFKKKYLNFLNQQFSYSSILSNFFLTNINTLLHDKIKKIIMPYEGQPFQNSILHKVHLYNNKIKTMGYIHSFPSGLPSNYVKRSGYPKKIIVTSQAQKFCFSTHLGWKKDEILVLPSSRYLKNKNINMKNKIYLPINFIDQNLILALIRKIIKEKKLNLKNFEIKNHPHCLNSKKHHNLIIGLKRTIVENSFIKREKQRSFSIFIGPTASVIEALERNTSVYHICEIPELESYNKKIWKYIKSYSIDNNIFEYKVEKKNKLINLGKSISLYKTYFKK